MSTCGTDAWAATDAATVEKPPPMPWRICVQTISATDPFAPHEWIIRPTPLRNKRHPSVGSRCVKHCSSKDQD